MWFYRSVGRPLQSSPSLLDMLRCSVGPLTAADVLVDRFHPASLYFRERVRYAHFQEVNSPACPSQRCDAGSESRHRLLIQIHVPVIYPGCHYDVLHLIRKFQTFDGVRDVRELSTPKAVNLEMFREYQILQLRIAYN